MKTVLFCLHRSLESGELALALLL